MITFQQYITEAISDRGLTIFDIDETLFMTKALIYVMKDSKVVKKLNNQDYNTHKLQPGETYDYREFKDAETFAKTSVPITKMIDRAKAIIKRATAKGSKVIIVTARSDFHDKEKFLNTFRTHGIPIDDVYIERAGNLGLGSASKNKRFILHKYLRKGAYGRVRFFDDSMANITMFKSLEKKYPDIKFYAYLVKPDGSTKKV